MNFSNFKMIDTLLQATNGYTGAISSDYTHLNAAKNSTSHFYEELAKLGYKPENLPDSFDEAMVAMENEYERQGFINGFRMGARLMMECIGPAPLEAWDPEELYKAHCLHGKRERVGA